VRVKPDLYTKTVLTVIALLLLLIACNQYVSPATTASAQGPLAGTQFAMGPLFYLTFTDPRTGEIWVYDSDGGGLHSKYRMVKLGQPLVKEK
jgi:hypothetical protein